MNHLFFYLFLFGTNQAWASLDCSSSVQNAIPLLQAVEIKKWTDTESAVVTLSAKELSQTHMRITAPLRSEFDILIIQSNQNALLALVPKSKNQVVQWQLTDIPIQDFVTESVSLEKSRVVFKIKKQKWWQKDLTKFKSHLVIAPKIQFEAVSFESLVSYLKSNPRLQDPKNPTSQWSWVKSLFGKSWTKIFSPQGKLNALESSIDILEEKKLIVPKKEKFLHVNGEIFTSLMTIVENSPFTGNLAPGHYQILGRFSASMKDLNLKNAQNEAETNSLAISLLIFKTGDLKEIPGVLFLQDSLPNITNVGLQNYALSNNPNFAFRPTNLTELIEQSFAIFGVGFSSLKNSRDSGRGVQGNFRSTLGAAGVGFENNDMILGPKFIALKSSGLNNQNVRGSAKTHADLLKNDPNHQFQLITSEDGKNWQQLGALHSFQWLNIDSHELTFPHSTAGTIDPNSLRAAGGLPKSTGLILPTSITTYPTSSEQIP